MVPVAAFDLGCPALSFASAKFVAISSSVDLLRWLPGRLHYTACEYIGSVSSTGRLAATGGRARLNGTRSRETSRERGATR
jgi:hypothetical protein